jgi:hypothetical protein
VELDAWAEGDVPGASLRGGGKTPGATTADLGGSCKVVVAVCFSATRDTRGADIQGRRSVHRSDDG